MDERERRDGRKGLLLTFEGIDGSGKSTQARKLTDYLRQRGRAPLLVREPGGTPLSERVRALLLDRALEVGPTAELLLFAAARAQLCAEVVRPALEAGRVVVCDRFYDSTTAYQGGGRGRFDPAWLEDLHGRVTGGLVPDRTYLVELPVEAAQARRSGVPDRMEAAGTAFQARVAAAYASLAEAYPGRFRRLDGTRSIASLHAEVCADVEALLRVAQGTPHSGSGWSERDNEQ